MGCQRRTAREIIEADAQYVLALKGNQGCAHQEIQSYLDAAIAGADPALARCEHVEKGHGRIETRRYWQSADIGWFADREKWEGLHSVGIVESVREIRGQAPFDSAQGTRSTERRYYLSSLDLGCEKIRPRRAQPLGRREPAPLGSGCRLRRRPLRQAQGRQSRARTGHATENLATLRKRQAQGSRI